MIRIVPQYAAVLGLLYVFLTLRVIRYRRGNRISLGHGGDPTLERLVRAHGNFAEFAPFALVLLGFVEARGWPGFVVHALCVSLTTGRVLHGQALPAKSGRLRVAGMALTLASMITSCCLLLSGIPL